MKYLKMKETTFSEYSCIKKNSTVNDYTRLYIPILHYNPFCDNLNTKGNNPKQKVICKCGNSFKIGKQDNYGICKICGKRVYKGR